MAELAKQKDSAPRAVGVSWVGKSGCTYCVRCANLFANPTRRNPVGPPRYFCDSYLYRTLPLTKHLAYNSACLCALNQNLIITKIFQRTINNSNN